MPNVLGIADRGAVGRQLFRQVLLSMLIGNGDLHMRNLALLGRRDACWLSAVYDPAPMRAWDEHNIVAACNLGGLDLERAVAPAGLGHAVVAFAEHCGLGKGAVADEMERCLSAATQFQDGVRDCGAPEATKQTLLKRAAQVRQVVEAVVPPKPAPRRQKKPVVPVPDFPADTHEVLAAKDGSIAVFLKGAGRRLDNPVGPAAVSPSKTVWAIGGVEMTEDDWGGTPGRRRTAGRPSKPVDSMG